MQIDNQFMTLIVYVDDILVTGNYEEKIFEVKQFLHKEFTIKDLGQANFFLRVEFHHTNKGIFVSQEKYILDTLSETNMLEAHSCPTPYSIGCKLKKDDGVSLDNPGRYRRLVGRLIYLTVTRPDITYAVQQLSQFMVFPTDKCWKIVLRVLKYLKGTRFMQLKFDRAPITKLQAYCDFVWGSYLDTRKSIYGFCIFLGNNLLSRKTKKQATVA